MHGTFGTLEPPFIPLKPAYCQIGLRQFRNAVIDFSSYSEIYILQYILTIGCNDQMKQQNFCFWPIIEQETVKIIRP